MNYSDYKELEQYNQTPPRPNFCIDQCDSSIGYVGWDHTKEDNEKIAFIFSKKNIDYLSETISEALTGVDPENRKIIIPDNRICEVLSSVYKYGTRANIGAIYSKDVIGPMETRNDIKNLNNQTITIIVSAIREEIEMAENNKKLTVWDSLLGDFNRNGLRQHPPIKLRVRKWQPMYFFENY